LQRTLREQKIGIFRVESVHKDIESYVVTVAEDLDCSGIPVCSEEICVYDEGFFAGVMQAHSGAAFQVKEVDCWGSGDRVCRFTIARV
jgi:predicted hydrocarbon binding protein